jgi:hypothetical protein
MAHAHSPPFRLSLTLPVNPPVPCQIVSGRAVALGAPSKHTAGYTAVFLVAGRLGLVFTQRAVGRQNAGTPHHRAGHRALCVAVVCCCCCWMQCTYTPDHASLPSASPCCTFPEIPGAIAAGLVLALPLLALLPGCIHLGGCQGVFPLWTWHNPRRGGLALCHAIASALCCGYWQLDVSHPLRVDLARGVLVVGVLRSAPWEQCCF